MPNPKSSHGWYVIMSLCLALSMSIEYTFVVNMHYRARTHTQAHAPFNGVRYNLNIIVLFQSRLHSDMSMRKQIPFPIDAVAQSFPTFLF